MSRIYDGAAPIAYERVSGPGNLRPRRHAENPDEPGTALCGARLPPDAIRVGDGECVLCHVIIEASRDWVSR